MVKGATKIYPSPQKFDVSELEFQSTEATQITLSQVDETQAFTIIDVFVKVMSCSEPVTLGTHQKQKVQVSDASGCGIVWLWENIGLLSQGRNYKLQHFRTVEYENKVYCYVLGR